MTEETYDLPGATRSHSEQGKVYLATPPGAGALSARRLPVLMALHGSGRLATSYRDVPFYRFQRDCAIEAGYLFACVSNGPDTWGRDAGLHNLELLSEHLRERCPVRSAWVLWATSAGGVLLHRWVQHHADRVRGAIGTFPVYDLLDAFSRSPACAAAWGVRTKTQLEAAVRGRNPPEFVDELTSCEYLILHGREDVLLPPERHALRFRDEANARGGRVELVLTEGGHSTENQAVCDRALLVGRLRQWVEG